MAGTPEGAIKCAAKKVGVPLDVYLSHLSAGRLWCFRCREFQPKEEFTIDRSRWSGRMAACVRSRATGHPRGWRSRPAINPITGRPGPAPKAPVDGDKKGARARVNHEVKAGRMGSPNSLNCHDCGHLGTDKRHEYDHYLGYAAANHLDVQAVCTVCHHRREQVRGTYGSLTPKRKRQVYARNLD